MMRRYDSTPHFLILAALALWLTFGVLMLTGCQTVPAASCAASAPCPAAAAPTTDDRINLAEQELALALTGANKLLRAGQMTLPQHEQFMANEAKARALFESARGLNPTDPAQAAQILANALNQLVALQVAAGVSK